MRIPFMKRAPAPTEQRNAPYADAIVAQIIATAQGNGGQPNALTTAALEIASGVIARAFASAKVEGASIPAHKLANLARAVITHGEAVAFFDGLELIEITNFEIMGGVRRADWRYKYNISSPGGFVRDGVSVHSRTVHWQYSYDLNRSWVGVGPLARAVNSGALAANIEDSLKKETSGPVGYLLPIPTDPGDATVAELKRDIKSLKGETTVVETTAGGWGEGRIAAPRNDYVPQRIGPAPPPSMVQIHSAIQNAVLAACGVPVELVTVADGTGQREAWRRCLHGTVQPLAIILSQELSRVYARDVTLTFDRLFASDIAGRARAFQSFVQGGMPIEQAAAVSGVMADED